MKCLCLIPTADLRVYTIHTTTIPVPVTCREGSCSPNLPWPQNLSTQDCRQPIPTIGTRDEILCFGQDSVNELDLLRETQQRLPFCFGSSRTSNAQAKFTGNRLLPGHWGADNRVPTGPIGALCLCRCHRLFCQHCVSASAFLAAITWYVLGVSHFLWVILMSACSCGFCLLLPNPRLSQPRRICPRLRLYQCDTRGVHTQVT